MRRLLTLLAIAIPCVAQTFEVASVKPTPPKGAGKMSFHLFPGGRFVAENVPLRLLVQHAYGVRGFQIEGGPAWVDTERFDIDARAGDATANEQAIGRMQQALLADRFHLKIRRQIKDVPAFLLTEAPSGTKFKRAHPTECAPSEPPANAGATVPVPCHQVVLQMSANGARLLGEQATLAELLLTLASILGHPVIDKTACAQEFDIDLAVSMEGLDGIAKLAGLSLPTPPSSDAPSIFTALPESLGLKLSRGKGPVEMLVIESAERPSAN